MFIRRLPPNFSAKRVARGSSIIIIIYQRTFDPVADPYPLTAALSKNYLNVPKKKNSCNWTLVQWIGAKNSTGVLVMAGALSQREDGSRQGN